jgi:hypothetical protein
MDEETIVYLVFCAMLLAIVWVNVSSFGGGFNTYIVVILLGLMLAFLLTWTFADFIVFPLVMSTLGITFQPARYYKITKGQDMVLKNVNGLYYATGYLTANLFAYVFKAERIQEGEDVRQLQAPEAWEKALMSISFPFKFNIIASGLDIQIVRDELEGKRSYQEFQLSKVMQSANPNESIIADIQRKINVIQTQIDRISQEEKPIATLMYVETTAVGVTEKAAADALANQTKQLQIALGVLDVQLMRVVGRELYTLFKFGYAPPTTYEEVATNFDKQK